MWRFIFTALLTVLLVWMLDSSLKLGGKSLPAFGKLLSPSHGFWQNAENDKYFDNILRPGDMEDDVRIVFDKRMVPHIFAQTERDLYFAQGYVHAMHRLWQMDITARAGAGRVAEIMGPGALDYDRSQRQKGMVWAAERELEAWENDAQSMQAVEAYTAGINYYIDKLKPSKYPIEFKLLGYKPEHWTPLKTALFVKSMATTLCSNEYDLEFSTMLDILGPELFDFYFPEYNPDQDPIIPPGTPWDFNPVNPPVATTTEMPKSYLGDAVEEYPESFVGSNNWAVAGGRTASGLPILCNDPHLKLSLPSIWYEIHLVGPELNAYGVSFAGMPFVIIGFNEEAAWGATNVGQDMLDWYEVSWVDNEHSKYYLDGAVIDVGYRYESIKIKGGEEITDTVTYTHWGPVQKSGEHRGLAMRWIAHDKPPFSDTRAFHDLNKVSSPAEFMSALNNYYSPAQNFVFADKSNNVAMRIGGALPVRPRGQGRFVSDGSSSSNGWQETAPPEHNPKVINPERGFVSSANQKTTDDSYPYYYTGGKYFEDYRGRTLNRYLAGLDAAGPTEMKQFQQSAFSLRAELMLPLMIDAVDSVQLDENAQSMVSALRMWDYFYDHDKTEPIMFEQWFTQIARLTWDEISDLPDSLLVTYPESWRLIDLATNAPDTFVFDIQSTEAVETFPEIALQALHKASEDADQLSDHTWGTYRKLTINHLANLPAFSRVLDNASGHGSALNATTSTNGPSWRMIVELGEPVRAHVVYPGGQSGNPGSKYYDNMVDDWVEGNYFSVELYDTQSEIDALYSLTFEKKGK